MGVLCTVVLAFWLYAMAEHAVELETKLKVARRQLSAQRTEIITLSATRKPSSRRRG